LNKEDLTLDQASTREEQWAYYVDSYYMHADTEGVATDLLASPWLRRSATIAEFPQESSVLASELQVKICLNTYKLFYLVNTEDTLVRSKQSRLVSAYKLHHNRDERKAAGTKWTQRGYLTKEEQNEAAAAAEVREQQIAAQPAITASATQDSVAPSETPAPQNDVVASPDQTSIPPAAAEELAPSNDVKIESPPAPVEGEAMVDIEIPDPVAVVQEDALDVPAVNEDTEMPDA
jgi:hypothetical protein